MWRKLKKVNPISDWASPSQYLKTPLLVVSPFAIVYKTLCSNVCRAQRILISGKFLLLCWKDKVKQYGDRDGSKHQVSKL